LRADSSNARHESHAEHSGRIRAWTSRRGRPRLPARRTKSGRAHSRAPRASAARANRRLPLRGFGSRGSGDRLPPTLPGPLSGSRHGRRNPHDSRIPSRAPEAVRARDRSIRIGPPGGPDDLFQRERTVRGQADLSRHRTSAGAFHKPHRAARVSRWRPRGGCRPARSRPDTAKPGRCVGALCCLSSSEHRMGSSTRSCRARADSRARDSGMERKRIDLRSLRRTVPFHVSGWIMMQLDQASSRRVVV
jgi:hypothetical protein